jgi:hypothetical protein
MRLRQRVEGVEKLLFRSGFTGDKLNIVNNQQFGGTVLVVELSHILLRDVVYQLVVNSSPWVYMY